MPQNQAQQYSLGRTCMSVSSVSNANMQSQGHNAPSPHPVHKNLSATQNHRVRSTVGATSTAQALSIDLSRRSLRHLPEDLINATQDQLERLSVAYNFLTHFPTRLPDCTYLRYLNAKNNHLVTFPLPICHLYRLEILDLANNRLTAIPEEIANLSVLRILSVSHNFLTKLPYCTGRMASLQLLKADDNPLIFPPAKLLAPQGNKESADAIVTQRIMGFFEQNVYSRPTIRMRGSSIPVVASSVVQLMAPLHKILRILARSARHTIALRSSVEKTLDRARIHLRELQLTIDYEDDEGLGSERQLREASVTVLDSHMRLCLELSSHADVLVRNAQAHDIRTLLVLLHTTGMELRAVLGRWGNSMDVYNVTSQGSGIPSTVPNVLGLGHVTKPSTSAIQHDESFKDLLLFTQKTCDLVQASIQPLHDQILTSLSRDQVAEPVQVEQRQQLIITCSSILSKAKSFYGYAFSFMLTEPQSEQFESFKRLFTDLVISWTRFGHQLKGQHGTLRIPANIRLRLQNTQINLKRCTQLLLVWERRLIAG
ncbi:L domain-like protein [Colletotrichum somersetense]|nr:L domain-like protein [Colletotrichum somersetense]